MAKNRLAGGMRPGEGRNSSGWGNGGRAGQVVIFVLALVILLFHTFSHDSTGWKVNVDSSTFWLFLVMGLALALPYIRRFRAGKEGVEALIDPADRAVSEAGLGGDQVPVDPRELQDAAQRPLESLEQSRRILAKALTELAEAEGLGHKLGSIRELADALADAKKISSASHEAVIKLAERIAEAKRDNQASPVLAREINYATQMLSGLFRQQARATKRRGTTN